MLDYFKHTRDGKTDWYRDDKPLMEEGYTTHLIANEASRLIRQQPSDKPLFLYVPFNGIHSPNQVPASYLEPYKNLPEPRRKIAGMLAAVDEAIGQIAAALQEKGMSQNTLILFSSDNGGPGPGVVTMNTPLRAGKGTLYEGGVRVCAFATWPGKIPAGITIDEPLHAVDWFPTLVQLTGAPSEQKLAPDGLDIWPVLTQGAKSPHQALLIPGLAPDQMALRMGDWKLLLNASDKAAAHAKPKANQTAAGKVELYNLATDIGETNDLATAEPARAEEMRARLNALIKDAVAPGGGSESPSRKRREDKDKQSQ
jgi:arylsulfatase A-like enzyme